MLCRVVARLPKALHTSQRCNTALACRPYWAIPHPNYLKPSIGTETTTIRPASSSASSTRWKERQARDSFSREAKVAGLKSRAAFKLLEINEKYHIFRRGDTVVDLGYAPGSWSQVAVNRTQPGGKVVGIDIIPAQPPRGVSTLQGDFLSPAIREELVKYVRETGRTNSRAGSRNDDEEGWTEEQFGEEGKGMIQKRLESGPVATLKRKDSVIDAFGNLDEGLTKKQKDVEEGRVVNVVLSDMMMNASGMAFRDHAGSMDLCNAALLFCYDTLVTGGHFLCKFYQGAEDHALEMKLKKLFDKVHRIKPESSRKESKETYLVGLRRRGDVAKDDVFDEPG